MNSLSTIRKLHQVREVNDETHPTYGALKREKRCKVNEAFAIRVALGILKHRMVKKGISVTSPQDSQDFLKLQLADNHHEVFGTMYLDTRHRLIKFEESFHGTIDGASVHPRVIATRCLELGAAAVVFAHNHPSDDPLPSEADKTITHRLKKSLALIDVRVLDHIVVSRDTCESLAQRGDL